MALLATAALAAVSISASYWWSIRHDRARAVAEYVRDTLKDPDSAQFRNVRVYSKHDAACGEVNAKNSMGGYVGFTPFILFGFYDLRFMPTDMEADIQHRRDLFNILLDSNCRDR